MKDVYNYFQDYKAGQKDRNKQEDQKEVKEEWMWKKSKNNKYEKKREDRERNKIVRENKPKWQKKRKWSKANGRER